LPAHPVGCSWPSSHPTGHADRHLPLVRGRSYALAEVPHRTRHIAPQVALEMAVEIALRVALPVMVRVTVGATAQVVARIAVRATASVAL
jgi:hypothetical protein